MSLLTPYPLGSLSLRNRLVLSPMCQYSAVDGMPNDWHLVHLGSRAVGGAGLLIAEASAVTAPGRITPGDVGLWNDAQAEAWRRITGFVRAQGAAICVQLAHAGRKASTDLPWKGGKSLAPEAGGWVPIAPSALSFSPQHTTPQALDEAGIEAVIADFRTAARRAGAAGFDAVEIHAAHGYLLHEFLSPLTNHRADAWGGTLANRARLLRRIVAGVRAVWPAPKPLLVRVSATDWEPGGWDIDECVTLARWLHEDGVDLLDVSAGGLTPDAKIPAAPGYQVPFAARIRREAGIATGAVGLITESGQAEAILAEGSADLILIGREFLRDPYFPRRAATELGQPLTPPPQYLRGW